MTPARLRGHPRRAGRALRDPHPGGADDRHQAAAQPQAAHRADPARGELGMLEGMVRLLPSAEVGFLGTQRDEETLEAITYANRSPCRMAFPRAPGLRARPDARDGRVDADAIKYLIERAPTDITGGLPAQRPRGRRAPPGGAGRRRAQHHPGHRCDRRESTSTRSATRSPGLGDAGDRLYGLAQ